MFIVFTLFNVYWFGRVLQYRNNSLLDLSLCLGLCAPVFASRSKDIRSRNVSTSVTICYLQYLSAWPMFWLWPDYQASV